jgi:hypothetical protein
LTKQILNKALPTKKYLGTSVQTLVLCLFFIVLLSPVQTMAQFNADYQQPDSTFLLKHSPLKATFLSAVVPGLGQVYNEKYWKVPIIYAGLVGMIYYANFNDNRYEFYKNAYNIKIRISDGETGLTDPFPSRGTENILQIKDYWRRNRDLIYISIGLLYVAQILDSNVDANLFDYDMSEDLSLRLEPTISPMEPINIGSNPSASVGLRFAIRF